MRLVSAMRVWYWAGRVLIPVSLLVGSCAGGNDGDRATGVSTPTNFDFGDNDSMRASTFGDSVTAGQTGDRITRNNYPNNLEAMLRSLDPNWRVINRGIGGEQTQDGVRRLPSVLGQDHPGYVLIMEGTNDASLLQDPAFIAANLQQMVREARASRSIPVLGTIPPNFREHRDSPQVRDVINRANVLIRTMARAERVALAEVFNGMNDPSLFGLPGDGLHPNERGYQVMAGIWFDAMIRAVPTAPPPTPRPPDAGSERGQRVRRR
jgi:lysophospholipase L1-like esterase